MSYYLPGATRRLVEQRGRTCQNLGLLLDKYIPREVIESSKQKGERRREWLQTLADSNGVHNDAALAKQAYERWLALTNAFQATHFRAPLDWRMVVGLGGETVLETDLTLHHLYGVPYIPGSAIKGLARAYVTGEEQPSEKEEEDSTEILRIFGSQKQAGTVLFFDAWPLDGQFAFAVDIMNAHYPEYYSEGKTPSNTQDPNPVTFLTIENTDFVFAVAPRHPNNESDQRDIQAVKAWISAAIQRYGIGGKTSAGYGYFQTPQDVQPVETTLPQSPSSDPEMQRAEDAKRRLEALKEGEVAGQINGYYQQWQKLTSAEARKLLAQAIIDTVYRVKREKQSAEKPWYKELIAFLSEK